MRLAQGGHDETDAGGGHDRGGGVDGDGAGRAAGALAGAETSDGGRRVHTTSTSRNTGCRGSSEMTGGELKIELAPVGTIVPYNETMDAIGQGVLQGDITSTVYFTGRSKAFSMLGDLIAGYDTPEQMGMFCYLGGGKELLQELHDQYTGGTVQVVGCSTPAREAFVAKKPIRRMADFKGVKFRSPQGMTAEILKLGASIVVLPGGEVYSGARQGRGRRRRLGDDLDEPAHGLPRGRQVPAIIDHSMPVQEFTVNMATWKALPDDVKAIARPRCGEWTWDQVQRVAVDDVARAEGAEGQGRRAHPLGRGRDATRSASWRTRPGKTGRRRAARQAGLRLAARLAEGPRAARVTRARPARPARCQRARQPAPTRRRSIASATGSTGSTNGPGCSGASRSSPSRSRCSTRWWRARVRRADHLGQRDHDLPLGHGLPAGRRLRPAAPPPCPHRRDLRARCRRARAPGSTPSPSSSSSPTC